MIFEKEEYSLLTNLINILVGILLIIAILLMIIIQIIVITYVICTFSIYNIFYSGILKKKISGWILGILGLIFIILF
ncbi:hypothetical protein J4711_11485 [Staphylococcus epidermidis]|nr:hypothetical protein [Staphylococcus epidermidis]